MAACCITWSQSRPCCAACCWGEERGAAGSVQASRTQQTRWLTVCRCFPQAQGSSTNYTGVFMPVGCCKGCCLAGQQQ